MLLPRKIHTLSNVHLVHTSSPVSESDLKNFHDSVARLKQMFPGLKLFDVIRGDLEPQYLSASERERLKKLRRALKDVSWLSPVYGGTGALDIIRYLTKEELKKIRNARPVVNGFSDTTALVNFLYFKLGLLTFHYKNAAGLFSTKNSTAFFEVIRGEKNDLTFFTPQYKWLSPVPPQKPIEGIAIGGNLETMRDLIDICDIRQQSWKKYILFIEDVNVHIEDIHRILISLDTKRIFNQIRALVVGTFETKKLALDLIKIKRLFGVTQKSADKDAQHVITYLLNDVVGERRKKRDPLFILNVSDLGHAEVENPMIIPIGARTIITPDRKIKFIGPFVK